MANLRLSDWYTWRESSSRSKSLVLAGSDSVSGSDSSSKGVTVLAAAVSGAATAVSIPSKIVPTSGNR